MSYVISRSLLVVFALLVCGTSFSQEQVAIPPVSQVTDLTGTLDGAAQQSLLVKLQTLERAKGAQIAVLLIPTTGPDSIDQFATRVFEAWHLGRKGIDDGVLLLIAKEDRKVRIEVGRGLEGAIPDVIAKRITADVMAPFLKAGDYGAGLIAGVDVLAKLVNKEALPSVATGARVSPPVEPSFLLLALAGVALFIATAVVLLVRAHRRNDEARRTREALFTAQMVKHMGSLRTAGAVPDAIRHAHAGQATTDLQRAAALRKSGAAFPSAASLAALAVIKGRAQHSAKSTSASSRQSSSSRPKSSRSNSSSTSWYGGGSSDSGRDTSGSISRDDAPAFTGGGGESSGGGASSDY